MSLRVLLAKATRILIRVTIRPEQPEVDGSVMPECWAWRTMTETPSKPCLSLGTQAFGGLHGGSEKNFARTSRSETPTLRGTGLGSTEAETTEYSPADDR